MKGIGAGSGRSAWCYLKLTRYSCNSMQMHPETEGQMDIYLALETT